MAIATMRVPTIFTAVDRFSNVVNTMQRNVTTFGNAAEGASQRISRKLMSVGRGMVLSSGVMAGALAYPLKKAIEFEDQIASINTLLELNPDGIKKLGDEILKMAQKTSTPIEQLTKSYYDLISAGVKQSEAMAFLKSSDKLAITGLGTLPESTDVMLASMRNFAKDYKDTDEAANVLFKTVKYGKTTLAQLSEAYTKNAVSASLAGIKGREFNAAIAAVTTTTMPLAETENMLGNLAIALNKGKGKLPEIFKDNAVKNANQLLIKTGGFMQMLMAIDRSSKKLGINANKIFPLKGASVGFAILTKNQSVIDKYNESLTDMNDNTNNAIAKAFIIKQVTGKFATGILMNNLNAMAITVGTDLVPALIELTKYLNPLLKRFSEFVKANPGVVTSFAKIAIAIGSLGALFYVGGIIGKIFNLLIRFRNLAFVASWIEGIGVSFSIAAGAIGISALALGGWIALIIGGFVLLGVLINDVINHFDEWGRTILAFSTPLGTMLNFIIDIYDNWSYLTKAFQEGGIMKAFTALGDILKNSILDSLIRITNIMSRIPGFGGLTGISTELENAKVSMYDKSIPTGFKGNPVPAVWSNPTPENLSGKQNNFASMNPFMDFQNKGELLVNVKVDGGEVTSYDASKLNGIPAKVSSTKTPSKL